MTPAADTNQNGGAPMDADDDGLEHVEITSSEDLHQWLLAHYAQDASIWLVTFKKSVPDQYVSTGEVLDELIAFGWIDGRRRKLDDHRTMQLIAPRRTQQWAKTYKDRAARLAREGRMQPSGDHAIARSKRLGLWEAMADVDALEVPPDLAAALAATPPAAERFDGFAPSYRRNVLRWIKLAKRPETRSQRIAKTVALSARGEKIPQM